MGLDRQYEIDIDFDNYSDSNGTEVAFMQGDVNTSSITINLKKDNLPLDLTDCFVRVNVKEIYYNATIPCDVLDAVNGKILVHLPSDLVDENSDNAFNITVQNGSQVLNSAIYTYKVVKTLGDGVAGDSEEMSYLQTLIVEIQEFEGRVIDSTVKSVDERFDELTSKQQQDGEVIQARKGKVSLRDKIDSMDLNIDSIAINVKSLNESNATDYTSIITGLNSNVNNICLFPEGEYITTVLPQFKCYGRGVINFNGELIKLSNIPEKINNEISSGLRLPNVFIGNNSGNNATKNSRANTGIGNGALRNATDSTRNTGIGNGALAKQTNQYSNTAVGTDALGFSDYSDRNVAIGSNAMKWCGTTDPKGDLHDFYNSNAEDDSDVYGLSQKNPSLSSIIGTVDSPSLVASSKADNCNNVAIGRNSMLHGIKTINNTSIGYNAMAHAFENYDNVAVGKGALQSSVNGNTNVAIGSLSMFNNQVGDDNVAIGYMTMNENVFSGRNTCVGYKALSKLIGDTNVEATANNSSRLNTVMGWNAYANGVKGSSNVFIGASSGLGNNGSGNVGLGSSTLQNNLTGDYNIAIGYNSMMLLQDGTAMTAISNSTALGKDTRVSGDNQVQLGNSSSTTYVYGTVQNRSDERDKTDIRDTVLGLEFVNSLRPVDYKWDMRDDYVSMDEEGNIVKIEKDGSKKRNRYHHGLIAQEVKSVSDELGVEFGGYQDHSLDGGCDILSIGYDELIAPLIKSVQELSKEVETLKSLLANK